MKIPQWLKEMLCARKIQFRFNPGGTVIDGIIEHEDHISYTVCYLRTGRRIFRKNDPLILYIDGDDRPSFDFSNVVNIHEHRTA